ncbi:MAG: AsmA family protein [Gammaproteobacteria bacterium]|nr:AsmA family protein [Gammaproteobacteria bacterium]
MPITNKKIIKTILISIAAIIILSVGAATLFITTISQDTIKNKVSQLVHDKTGKDLKIVGNISWTIFPWLGIKIQDVSLSNPSDFKTADFAHAGEIGINVKLLPLILKRNIEADHLSLKDFDLHLTTNNLGNSNWENLSAATNISNAATTTKDHNLNAPTFSIATVLIKNGTIFWQDQRSKQEIKVSNLNLSCKNVDLEHPFDIKTSFTVTDLNPMLDGDIEASAQVTLNTASELYILKNLKLHTNNANAFGALQITKTSSTPTFSGNLTISDTGTKALTNLLGINSKTQPNTSFTVNLEFSPNLIKLPTIKAKFDDMVLEGTASYTANTIAFNLVLNKLDLDSFNEISRHTPITAPIKTQTTKSAERLPNDSHVLAKTTPTPKPSTSDSSPPKPSASNLSQSLKLNGDLKIGTIQFDKIKLSSFATKITGSPNLINCQDLMFDFYQKKAVGNASADIRSSISKIHLKLALANLPMKALLMDLANYEKFSGSLTLNTEISLSGKTSAELLNSLNGNGNALITNGSYQGVDIPYEVRRVHSVLNSKPMPQKSSPPHTDFEQLTMSFNINNALLNTNDILIQSPDYKVTGKGNANLISRQLELLLSAYSMNDKNFFVPIKITGPFASPSIKLDTAVMLQHEIKKTITNVIEKQVDKFLPQDLKKILPLDKLLH